jgi:hypothetical protein
MAKAPRPYQRLTRSQLGLATYSSLWLAKDHLLLVESSGFHESYHRFYLRDIKAFVVSDSDRFLYSNIIVGLLVVIAGVPVVMRIVEEESPLVPLFFLVPSLIVLIANLILGRSCRVDIVTALQTRRLKPLSRRRRTRKVLDRLEPLVRAAQASLAPSPATAPPKPATEAPPPTLQTG